MTSYRLLARFSIGAAIIAALGCQPDTPPPPADTADSAPEEVVPLEPATENPPEEKTEGADLATPLEDGTHGAFGLKMPRGMIPIQVPAKDTYRFEGTHQLSILRRYLMRQLDAPYEPVEEEGGRILVRQAKVKSGGDPDARIGLRLFDGSLGGGSVDVWQETVPFETAENNARALPAPEPWRPSRGYGKDGERERPKPVSKIPSQRRRQVWEMMEKVRRGEKLTEKDLDNPYLN